MQSTSVQSHLELPIILIFERIPKPVAFLDEIPELKQILRYQYFALPDRHADALPVVQRRQNVFSMGRAVHPSLHRRKGDLIGGIPGVFHVDDNAVPYRFNHLVVKVIQKDVFRQTGEPGRGSDLFFLVPSQIFAANRRIFPLPIRMAEIPMARHVLAVAAGDPGKLFVPGQRSQSVVLPFPVDEPMDLPLHFGNVDCRRRTGSSGQRIMNDAEANDEQRRDSFHDGVHG